MPKTRRDYRDGIHVRNGRFAISFVDWQGRRRNRTISASTIQQARAVRSKVLEEEEKRRVLGYAPPSEDTFADFAVRFLRYQEARLTPKVYAREKGIVEQHLKPAFGARRLAELRREDVEQYITDRSGHVAPASVTKELNVLKHLLALAVDWKLLTTNCAHRVKPPRAPAGRVRYLQPQELQLLMAACPAWLRPVVALLVCTGMRRGELLGLRWLDVDVRNRSINLPQTKNGHGRTVVLNASALSVLAALPHPKHAKATDTVFTATEPYRPENVSVAFARACRRAGILDFRLHDLRHTCASHMRMAGAEIDQVARQLGHRDVRQAVRYQHLSPAYQQEAVQRLDGVFGAALLPAAGYDRVTIEGKTSPNRAKPIKPRKGAALLLSSL